MSNGLMRLFSSNKDEKKSGGGLAKLANNAVSISSNNNVHTPDIDYLNIIAGDQLKNRIAFVVDRTSSRRQSWSEATAIFNRMLGTLDPKNNSEYKLYHFGGGHLSSSDWKNSPQDIASIMKDTSCQAGDTLINPALQEILSDKKTPKAVILIGDAFEEDTEQAYQIAQAMKDKGIKIFSFYEKKYESPESEKAFQEFAHLTGGVYEEYGENTDLSSLCEATVVWSIGGNEALKQLAGNGNTSARKLLGYNL